MASPREPADRNLCLDALGIAIDTTVDEGGQWYNSTKELQVVCLDLCVTCRSCWNISTWHVVVSANTPRRLWLREERDALARGGKRGAPRVPPFPARAVTVVEWPRHVLARLSEGYARGCASRSERPAMGWMRRLRRARPSLSTPSPLWWPDTLQELTLGISSATCFNQDIEQVAIPEQAIGRQDFNQRISLLVLPASLQQLSFGGDFNQPIARAAWPASLQQLSFGDYFNQPIDKVAWAASLKQLSFGRAFDQPITGVTWPASLQQLSFGQSFNQPIAGVVWPPALQQLSFDGCFNHPIAGVAWPASLQQLSFSESFTGPFTQYFNQNIFGVVWPASLRQLSFGNGFKQPIAGASWPPSLQQLSFGRSFNQPITGVEWPASLRLLTVKGKKRHLWMGYLI